MTSGQLTRRQFVAASLGAAAATFTGCFPSYRGQGIYTDRLTYRAGLDPLRVHLGSPPRFPVEVTVNRKRSGGAERVACFTVVGIDLALPSGSPTGSPDFVAVAELSTAGWTPGIYQIDIPTSALSPTWVENTGHHQWSSRNWYSRFVVTPAQAASHSSILWLHDSLTGAAYGSFGGRSIYGIPPYDSRTVSYLRPGIGNSTLWYPTALFLGDAGYEMEYADLVYLAERGPGFLDAYDTVLIVGQFEYVPNAVVDELARFADTGGKILAATHEFAIQRVDLDPVAGAFTTYRFDEAEDPNANTAAAAGVGMNNPAGTCETEVLGQTVWAASRVSSDVYVDLELANTSEAGWLFDGTSLGDGDVLPGAFKNFASGTLIDFDHAGQPFAIDSPYTRQPETLVWAVTPAPEAEAWWLGKGLKRGLWPKFPGWACCSLQERSGGGRVVTLPTPQMITDHLGDPLYEQIFLNAMGALT